MRQKTCQEINIRYVCYCLKKLYICSRIFSWDRGFIFVFRRHHYPMSNFNPWRILVNAVLRFCYINVNLICNYILGTKSILCWIISKSFGADLLKREHNCDIVRVTFDRTLSCHGLVIRFWWRHSNCTHYECLRFREL